MSEYQQPTNRVNQFLGGKAAGQPIPSQSPTPGPGSPPDGVPADLEALLAHLGEQGSFPAIPPGAAAAVILPDVEALFPPIPPELAATTITFGEVHESLRSTYQVLASALQSSVTQQDQFIRALMGELMPSILGTIGEMTKGDMQTMRSFQQIYGILRERGGGWKQGEDGEVSQE